MRLEKVFYYYLLASRRFKNHHMTNAPSIFPAIDMTILGMVNCPSRMKLAPYKNKVVSKGAARALDSKTRVDNLYFENVNSAQSTSSEMANAPPLARANSGPAANVVKPSATAIAINTS